MTDENRDKKKPSTGPMETDDWVDDVDPSRDSHAESLGSVSLREDEVENELEVPDEKNKKRTGWRMFFNRRDRWVLVILGIAVVYMLLGDKS